MWTGRCRIARDACRPVIGTMVRWSACRLLRGDDRLRTSAEPLRSSQDVGARTIDDREPAVIHVTAARKVKTARLGLPGLYQVPAPETADDRPLESPVGSLIFAGAIAG